MTTGITIPIFFPPSSLFLERQTKIRGRNVKRKKSLHQRTKEEYEQVFNSAIIMGCALGKSFSIGEVFGITVFDYILYRTTYFVYDMFSIFSDLFFRRQKNNNKFVSVNEFICIENKNYQNKIVITMRVKNNNYYFFKIFIK